MVVALIGAEQWPVQERVAPHPGHPRRQPPLHRLLLQPSQRGHHLAGGGGHQRRRGVPQVRVRGLHGRVCQAEVPGQGAQVRSRQGGGAKIISGGLKLASIC